MESYKYLNAIRRVEALLESAKDMKAAVEKEKEKRKGTRASFYGGIGLKDPTAYTAAGNVDEVPLITFMNDEGEVLTVQEPEAWLNVFDKGWSIYHDVAGNDAWITMRHRYYNLWPVKKVTEKDGVSKRLVMFRRNAFLTIMLVLAAQASLIKIK